MSSACPASPCPPTARRTSSRQASAGTPWRRSLRMFLLRDPPDGLDEGLPSLPLCRQHFATFGRQPIETAAPFTCGLDPSADDPAAAFEPVEQGVDRGRLEAHRALGALLDQLTQVV